MAGLRFAAGAVVALLVIGLVPRPAQAQNGPTRQILIEPRLTVWSTNSSARSGGSEFGRWGSTMWGLELTARKPGSPWRVGGEWLGGGQHGGEGPWFNLRDGQNKLFSAWLGYELLQARPALGLSLIILAGYEKARWNTTFASGSREAFRAKGFMLGVLATFPLAENLSLGGHFHWVPSANTSLERSTGTTNSTGSITDGALSLTYTQAMWNATLGYRWINSQAGELGGCVGCSFKWTGIFFALGYVLGIGSRPVALPLTDGRLLAVPSSYDQEAQDDRTP